MKPYRPFRVFENAHYFIKEAVIHTDKYLNIIKNDFNLFSIKDVIEFNSIQICNYLNKYILYLYKIKLQLIEGKGTYGVIKGKTKYDLDIFVYCSQDLNQYFQSNSLFELFKEKLFLVLAHELPHRGQYIQVKKHVHIGREVKINDLSDLKYYKQKEELMSFSNMIIEELRFNGYDNNEIIKGIKYDTFDNTDSEFLNFYKVNFDNDKSVLNQLYKYIYEYLKLPKKIEL